MHWNQAPPGGQAGLPSGPSCVTLHSLCRRPGTRWPCSTSRLLCWAHPLTPSASAHPGQSGQVGRPRGSMSIHCYCYMVHNRAPAWVSDWVSDCQEKRPKGRSFSHVMHSLRSGSWQEPLHGRVVGNTDRLLPRGPKLGRFWLLAKQVPIAPPAATSCQLAASSCRWRNGHLFCAASSVLVAASLLNECSLDCGSPPHRHAHSPLTMANW